MDDNAINALMMSFGLLVLIIALSISVYMFTQVTNIAEKLIYYSDSTNYYDSIKNIKDDSDVDQSVERYVDVDTIIPTLYRYDKENFCVKIYDATENKTPELIQIFDRNIENRVNTAVGDSKARYDSFSKELRDYYAYKNIYNDKNSPLYMFGAPWTGSPENVRKRIDYYISGTAGYIEGVYVDYHNFGDSEKNIFAKAIDNTLNNVNSDIKFTERFISYSYSGDTFTTDDGDELVTVDSKDRIVIIYTITGEFND